MSKKVKGPDVKRVLTDAGKDENPFSSIVLKEKKEVKKEVKVTPKKPNEIVQGYVPSLSFADILDSYEKTGNPYAMPKPKAKNAQTSFGDVLDKWENKDKKKESKKAPSSYKPTRSFADILNQYEGSNTPKKPEPVVKKEEVRIKGTDFFIKEEEPVDKKVSWSINGGKNINYVKPEEKVVEEKKEEKYQRVSKEYVAKKDFSEVLEEFEKGKVKKEEPVIKEEVKPVDEVVDDSARFFIKEEEPVDKKVSWSINGGKNPNYVKPEEPVIEEKKEEYQRVSKEYVAKKDFSKVLEEFEKTKETPVKQEEKPVEVIDDSARFFIKEEEPVDEKVSWSINGGKNPNYVKTEEPVEEKPVDDKVSWSFNSGRNPNYERQQDGKSFSEILSEYDKSKNQPSFEEILKQKEESKPIKTYTINELRRMTPQVTLDLHGETVASSEEKLRAFLQDAWEHKFRKISIITGKGLHSEEGISPVRSNTELILKKSDIVSEISFAPQSHGGSGALWVILKAQDK